VSLVKGVMLFSVLEPEICHPFSMQARNIQHIGCSYLNFLFFCTRVLCLLLCIFQMPSDKNESLEFRHHVSFFLSLKV